MTTPKPAPELQVIVNGVERTIFMSFALLNRCCYIVGGNEGIPLILQDSEMREAILVELLAERDEKGKVLKKYEIDELAVDFETVQNILEFVTGHVLDFTVAAAERSNRVLASQNDRLQKLAEQLPSTLTQNGLGN